MQRTINLTEEEAIMSRLKDEMPLEDEAPLEDEIHLEKDKTPLLETSPCKKCACSDFKSSSSDDKMCKCGHRDSDHKDLTWPGA